jgi:hypothetical protein
MRMSSPENGDSCATVFNLPRFGSEKLGTCMFVKPRKRRFLCNRFQFTPLWKNELGAGEFVKPRKRRFLCNRFQFTPLRKMSAK